MGRAKTAWTSDVEATIRQGIARGKTAAEISTELRAAGVKGASRATVDRRMRELRGKASAPRVPRARSSARADAPPDVPRPAPSTTATDAPPLPRSADDVPDDADPTTLDRWIEMADKAGRAAEARGDLAGIGAMGRLLARLMSDKTKFAPPEEEDPNDKPDMKALGARVAEKMHELIDKVAPK